MRALEKLPADRWTSAKEFAEALGGGGAPTMTRAVVAGRAGLGARRSVLGTAVATALLAGAAVGWLARRPKADGAAPIRFTVSLPAATLRRAGRAGGDRALA